MERIAMSAVDSTKSTDFGTAIRESWRQYEERIKESGLMSLQSKKLRAEGVAQIIETSRLLCEAFAAGRYGDWGRLFEGDPPFSRSNADRLRLIYENSTLRDSA